MRFCFLPVLLATVTMACANREDAPDASAISDPVAVNATFTGSESCVPCHEAEYSAWKGSHHDLAMDEATDSTVLGDFDHATFSHYGVTSRFFRRDGRFMVHTDGPDGRLQDFRIEYVFGVYPLQQYLIGFPDGRYQALSIAWDSRPREAGGQRWFHLYPDEPILAGDELHWTGANQNWNQMCAECHSTRLRKRYDPATDTYATDWSEIDVACEACHGAGSVHLEWAKKKQHKHSTREYRAMGLQVRLKDPAGGTWALQPGKPTAVRSAPWHADAQLETCGRCHARRTQIRDEYVHGRPLLDTHLPSLLEAGLYHADGQIRDEVYEYASFRQSRMYHQGVACSDCHDPHTLQLRAERDLVCGQCHTAAAFSTPVHHFHKADGKGASCIGCHMPAHTYMGVDTRYDHSMRVPRPDLSLRIGAPNACTTACHADRTDQWAADSAAVWWPTLTTRPQYGDALYAGRVGAPGAREGLLGLSTDAQQPAVVRATAAAMLNRYASPENHDGLIQLAVDADPLVRYAVALAADGLAPADRAEILAPLLDDPVRTVRGEAGRALAPLLASLTPGADRDDIQAALRDYAQMQRANSDRAFAHLNLGNLSLTLGDAATAEAEYRKAIDLEPRFLPAYVNLADLFRAQGRDPDGETVLKAALAAYPGAAEIHRALALLYTRERRPREAFAHIERAARLSPDDARVAYVYALALQGAGRETEAVAVLTRALTAAPFDRHILFALAAFHRDAGRMPEALGYARRLADVEPDDPAVRRMVSELNAAN
ncbi:MAG TPA: tetratricopeptide repeat protein [Candidatus Krumholzibacteria bacterium]|nr:tetratricopeptide repeat protein [Candidatus Krumholzibacteria bacterium]